MSRAAEILGVDPATVRGWARASIDRKKTRLRYARKFEGRYFVSKREIRSLLNRCKSRV